MSKSGLPSTLSEGASRGLGFEGSGRFPRMAWRDGSVAISVGAVDAAPLGDRDCVEAVCP